jgi:poly-gamma-glutamate synthesis protein (capsule biosynthesis protein)
MADPTLDSHTFDVDPGAGDRWSVAIAGDTVVEASSPPAVGDRLSTAVAAADLSVANLEAPIPPRGDAAAPIHKIGPTNETVPETPRYLREIGFDGVALANNHTTDYGTAGLERTLDACAAANLATCGVSGPEMRDAGPIRRSIRGQSVTVLNFCEREFGAAPAGETGTNWIGPPAVTRRIEAAAAAVDVLVVVVHGGIEYVPLPPPQLQSRLRSIADAGADLVVGHHPHVPQGWERRDGTPIVYSVGNFRYTRCCRPKTEWGLLLTASFRGDALERVALRPVERRGDAVQFMGERWDPAEFESYVETASELVADRERLRAHWQAQAVAVFEQRYDAWLQAAGGSSPVAIARSPGRLLGRDDLWDPEEREHEMLLLLNLVRNESHRAVIETAMAVRGGQREDRRTPAVRDRVSALLERTEDEPLDRDRSPATAAVRSLSAWLSATRARLSDR